MKAARGIIAIIVLLITMPIWYYLMYKILQGVNASDLMWFLYWVYLPFGFIASALQKLIEAVAKD